MSRLSLDIFDMSFLFFSWYIKPILFSKNFLLYIQFFLFFFIIIISQLLYTIYSNIMSPILYLLYLHKITSLFSIFFAIKFVLLIALLVFVRGGIPRYRYDFLTKLGWIKTLSLVLALFVINLLLSYL
jgi:NADH:ubiquinone oxidoreductase subunit H